MKMETCSLTGYQTKLLFGPPAFLEMNLNPLRGKNVFDPFLLDPIGALDLPFLFSTELSLLT